MERVDLNAWVWNAADAQNLNAEDAKDAETERQRTQARSPALQSVERCKRWSHGDLAVRIDNQPTALMKGVLVRVRNAGGLPSATISLMRPVR